MKKIFKSAKEFEEFCEEPEGLACHFSDDLKNAAMATILIMSKSWEWKDSALYLFIDEDSDTDQETAESIKYFGHWQLEIYALARDSGKAILQKRK